jgi:hypothetical protein
MDHRATNPFGRGPPRRAGRRAGSPRVPLIHRESTKLDFVNGLVVPHVLLALRRLLGEPVAFDAIAGIRPALRDMTMLAGLAGEISNQAAGNCFFAGNDFGHRLFYSKLRACFRENSLSG